MMRVLFLLAFIVYLAAFFANLVQDIHDIHGREKSHEHGPRDGASV